MVEAAAGRSLGGWQPRGLQVGGAFAYLVCFGALVAYGRPGLGIGELFFVPVVLFALTAGVGAGVASALAAGCLYAVALQLRAPASAGGLLSFRDGVHLAAYLAAGAVVGAFTRRARALLAEALHMLDALLELARRDLDTGALDSSGFESAIARRISRARPFALLVGELEAETARELRTAVLCVHEALDPDADIARAGSSQLVVLTAAGLAGTARELAGILERSLGDAGRAASFGWAFYPAEGRDVLQLLRAANDRLYARRLIRGEWSPTAASAELVAELPGRRSRAG